MAPLCEMLIPQLSVQLARTALYFCKLKSEIAVLALHYHFNCATIVADKA